MFFLDAPHDLAVAQIPRSGNKVIRDWLGLVPVVSNDNPVLWQMSRRIAYIREPMDRLESGFSLFYWMEEEGTPHVSNAPVDTWENFVDHVLDDQIPDDEHWLPQSIHVGDVPNEYNRVEDLVVTFERYRPGILPHMGKTSRSPIINEEYRRDELLVKYEDDTALYEAAGVTPAVTRRRRRQ